MNRWVFVLLVSCSVIPTVALAHNRIATYSLWELSENGASVRVKFPILAYTVLARLGAEDESALGDHVQKTIILASAAGPCSPSTRPRVHESDGWFHVSYSVRCPGPPAEVASSFLNTIPGHLHFVSITGPGIDRIDAVLSEASPSIHLAASEPPSRLRYLPLGVRHVLSGWDHLTFVLLLVLIALSTREVLAVVTGFTVGHSLTLGLSAMGYLIPDLRAVEVLIAISIVAVAVENVWLNADQRSGWVPIGLCAGIVAVSIAGSVPLFGVGFFMLCYFALLARLSEPRRFRWGLATLFGLVHGFGFATVLTEGGAPLTLGNLFAFNLGVEVGQIAVVIVALPVFLWLGRQGLRRPAVVVGSAVGAGIGTYATLFRALG